MLICPDCFSETGLKARILELQLQQADQQCDYHRTEKGAPLEDVMPIISEVISNTYGLSLLNQRTGEYDGLTLMDIVYELTGVGDDDVANEIKDLLIEGDDYWPPDGGEPFFGDDLGYAPLDHVHEDHSFRWQRFRDDIIYQRRFFGERALSILSEIFDGIHQLTDTSGRSVIYSLDPDDPPVSIFRARIANDSSTRQSIVHDPASQLGPPPTRRRQHRRMHPAGIQAFYGAFDVETCVAELRPAVGGTVIAARFIPIRSLVVLDTTRFDQPPEKIDQFDKAFLKRLRLWNFMQRFMHEIAQPHLPDTEYLEYIPTQAVAEYLVHLHKFPFGDKAAQTIDAIIFRSAQNQRGKNIAIFGDASSVEGSNTDKTDSLPLFHSSRRKPGLRIVQDSLEEHRISGVVHDTYVDRHIVIGDDLPF